jgi:hypothetical protein
VILPPLLPVNVSVSGGLVIVPCPAAQPTVLPAGDSGTEPLRNKATRREEAISRCVQR